MLPLSASVVIDYVQLETYNKTIVLKILDASDHRISSTVTSIALPLIFQ